MALTGAWARWRQWADSHINYSSTSPEEEAAFRRHAAASAVVWTRWVMATIVVSAFVFWPTDFLFLGDRIEITRTLAMVRLWVALVAGLVLWMTWPSRPLAPRPGLAMGGALVLGGVGAASAYGSLGGLDQPWFYQGGAVMALTVLMSVPFRVRMAFTIGLALLWCSAFFLPFPGNDQHPLLAHAVIFHFFVAGFLVLGGHLVYHLKRRDYFQGQRLAEKTEALAQEQKVSEALLLNVLPASVAEGELKAGRQPIAERFDSVTVLFADISGFTPMSRSMPAQEIVSLLNQIFSGFDALSERYGVEKIKTLGDAYMAAAGLPNRRPDHAEAIAEMALKMLDVVGSVVPPEGQSLGMRIGIATGPVVAGVIGTRRFIYDLWGETVNSASRMESHGVVGKIQVTPATRDALEASFAFQSRGEIEVKGMGQMETFFLEGLREEAVEVA